MVCIDEMKRIKVKLIRRGTESREMSIAFMKECPPMFLQGMAYTQILARISSPLLTSI